MALKNTSTKLKLSNIAIAIGLSLSMSGFAAAQGPSSDIGNLIWTDEFNGTTIDESKWNYDIGTGQNGWGNNELQYYTDSPDNAHIEDGALHITALKQELNGSNYTSARLTTKNKGDFKYGRIEVRAQQPVGRGLWAAAWMLPTDNVYGTWPNSGEMDIMEYVGYDPSHIYGTVHTGANNGANGVGSNISVNADDITNSYHTYAMEWTPTEIRIYEDDQLYFTYTKAADATSSTWPFNENFHILLNLAVGGNWGGAQGVDDSIFPASLLVDYVRVYELASATNTMTDIGNGTETISVTPDGGSNNYSVGQDGSLTIDNSLVGNIQLDQSTLNIYNDSYVNGITSTGTTGSTINVENSNVYGVVDLGENSSLNIKSTSGNQQQSAFHQDILVGQNSSINLETGTTTFDDSDVIELNGDGATLNIGSNASLLADINVVNGTIEGSSTGNLTATVTGASGSTFNLNGIVWNIKGENSIDKLTATQGSLINFPAVKQSAVSLWQPTALQITDLNATGLTVDMYADPETGKHDSITITNSAVGSNNTIDANLLNEGPETITLVTAPQGTSPDLFTINPQYAGFTIYTPNVNIDTSGDNVIFQVVNNTTVDENCTGTYVQNCSANQNAIASVTDALNAKTFIFYNEVEQMNERLGDLRFSDSNKESNVWAKYQYERNTLNSFDMNTSGFTFGIDKATPQENGKAYVGVMGSLAKADGSTDDNSADSTYGSAGVYFSYLANNNLFFDFVMKYSQVSTDYTFSTAENGAGFSASENDNSSMLSAAINLGYRITNDNFFFEPSAQISTGSIDSTSITGKDSLGRTVTANLESQTPFITKTGAQMGYNAGNVSTSFGVFYEKDWAQKDDQITLQDTDTTITYKAPKYARTVVNFSINGDLSENLNVYSNIEKSFGGDFETDIAGQIGLRYSF